MDFSDSALRAAVRSQLPPTVFRRQPWRISYAILLICIIVACGWFGLRTPWYVALPLAIVAGHSYATLMFFGHEVAHGAVVGARWLQDLVLYCGCAPYCLSPRLWRLWHNGVHHGHANVDIRDPDHFGMIPRYQAGNFFRRFVINNAPGSGRLVSLLYPFVFFTGHSQSVLWVESVGADEFRSLQRGRAKLDSFLMLLGWVALGILTGWRGVLYLIAIPMLVSNFVLMIYIFTNHLLRPLTEESSSLDHTMSVRTLRPLDWVHFHFSHHVEHHLFPSVASRHYPKIRKVLMEMAPDRYLAPPHWWAVKILYSTPRLYAQHTELFEPISGRRVSIASVEELLA